MSSPKFKVIIVGDTKVGKSSFVQCLKNREFKSDLISTSGVDIEKIKFKTSDNQLFDVDIWDCAGNEKGLESGYYIGAHAAIIMFDVKSHSSYKSVSYWYKLVRDICPKIPVVLCGNKVDGNYRTVRQENVTYHNKVNIPYFEISVKMAMDCLEPFLYIFRSLVSKKISYITIPLPSPDLLHNPLVVPEEKESIEWIDDNEYDDFYETMTEKRNINLVKISKKEFKENLERSTKGINLLSFITRSCNIFNYNQ